jgi:hypothetical protein
MYLKVARTITFFVILFISLDIVGASVAAIPSTSDHALTLHSQTLHSQKLPSAILTALLFEKAEEETARSEDEKYNMAGVVLLDFSRLAFSLSFYHTPPVQLQSPTFQYDVRPPLHELNGVFLI